MIGPAGRDLVGQLAHLIWHIRLPRVVLAALVGATLSMSGATYQGVFRNPLVDPYLLGVAAGAGLGATIVFAAATARARGWLGRSVAVAAFVGGLVAVAVTYVAGTAFGASRRSRHAGARRASPSPSSTAIQTFVLQRAQRRDPVVYSWILGRLSPADVGRRAPRAALHRRSTVVVLLPIAGTSTCCASATTRPTSLGTDVRRVRLIVVIAATLGTAAAVERQRADRLRRHHRAAHRAPARRRHRTAACCRCACSSALPS